MTSPPSQSSATAISSEWFRISSTTWGVEGQQARSRGIGVTRKFSGGGPQTELEKKQQKTDGWGSNAGRRCVCARKRAFSKVHVPQDRLRAGRMSATRSETPRTRRQTRHRRATQAQASAETPLRGCPTTTESAARRQARASRLTEALTLDRAPSELASRAPQPRVERQSQSTPARQFVVPLKLTQKTPVSSLDLPQSDRELK